MIDYSKTFSVQVDTTSYNSNGWNGPHGTCKECGTVFYYISSMWGGTDGHGGRYWTPSDLCGAHGGKYVEHEYIIPEEKRIKYFLAQN